MPNAPDPPAPAPLENPASHRLARVGCALAPIGLLLLLIAKVIESTGGSASTVRLVGLSGAGIMIVAVVALIGVATIQRRRTRKLFAGLNLGQAREADIATIKRIEGARLPATAQWEKFPTGLLGCRTIPNGNTPISVAINLPRLLGKKKTDPMEIPASYLWFSSPVPLPRLVLLPDGASAGIMGRDVDIENEQFNRRFRVHSTFGGRLTPGPTAPYDEFARYASAMLHPRAAECLLRLPLETTAIIDGDLVCAIDRPDVEASRIEGIAEILTQFVALVPDHVLRRWGGKTDYVPREN